MKFRIGSMAGAVIFLLIAPPLALAQIRTSLEHYTGRNAKGYLEPLKEAFGAALQAGMYRSAAIPRTRLKVDLDITAGFVKFSDSDRTFTAKAEAGFLGPTDTATAPTVVGGTTAVVLEGTGGAQFIFPGGLDMDSFGLPVPQLTVGGIMGTQAVLRWIAFDTGDKDVGKIKLIGFGLRHSLSQYIPASPVDVAAGVTWQSFEAGDKLVDSSALSIGAQASRRFSAIEPYAGVAVDRFEMSVDYDYESDGETIPLRVDFGRETNLHLSCGLGVNIGLLHLYAEVGRASRTVLSTGFSLGT